MSDETTIFHIPSGNLLRSHGFDSVEVARSVPCFAHDKLVAFPHIIHYQRPISSQLHIVGTKSRIYSKSFRVSLQYLTHQKSIDAYPIANEVAVENHRFSKVNQPYIPFSIAKF